MSKVTIKINNDLEIEAEQNGTSFIVPKKPDFPKQVLKAEVTSENGTEVFDNFEILECAAVDDNYWFGFHRFPEEEINQAKQQAQVLYTALKTDSIIGDNTEQISNFFKFGIYSEAIVKEFVANGHLTKKAYKEIVGKTYKA